MADTSDLKDQVKQGAQQEVEGLQALRQEIDSIDDQIHDLLMRRTEIVHGVARVKNKARQMSEDAHLVPSLAMRPDREASILRRLNDRHRGELPFHVISQLWRELINAKTRLQGPLAIALYADEKEERAFGARDLARAYYGAARTLEVHESGYSALEEVVVKPGVIGVLPIPVKGEKDPWWPHLLSFDGPNVLGPPRIVLRIPFLKGEEGAPEYPEAMTIACMDQVESGDDRSLFIVSCDVSGTPLAAMDQCAKGHLELTMLDEYRGQTAETACLLLCESPAFVGPQDPRLEDVLSLSGPVRHIRPVGGYAAPIVSGT
jgi:chorismate mutase/prephenate dehydratase